MRLFENLKVRVWLTLYFYQPVLVFIMIANKISLEKHYGRRHCSEGCDAGLSTGSTHVGQPTVSPSTVFFDSEQLLSPLNSTSSFFPTPTSTDVQAAINILKYQDISCSG